MTYELAKELKDAGFPCERLEQVGDEDSFMQRNTPTLTELIEACESDKVVQAVINREILIIDDVAIANLWLALNEK